MSFEQILEKKRILLAEIKRTRKGLDHLPHLDVINRERWDASTRIDSMKAKYGPDIEKCPGHVQAELRKAIETVNSAKSKVQAAKGKKDQIDARLSDLQEQLAAIDQHITVEDLLPMQATVTDLSQKIETLKGLIAEEEGKVAEFGNESNGTLSKLTRAKEDILAEIACGEQANHGGLAEIDHEISKEEGIRDSQAKEISTSYHKIAGLTRKIEQAREELTVAKQNLIDGLAFFIDQELEKAAGEYVKVASVLADSYSKVVALATVLDKCGAPKNIFGTHTRMFTIPSFLLDTCIVHESNTNPGVLFQFDGSAVQKNIDAEIGSLVAIGINIPDGITSSL